MLCAKFFYGIFVILVLVEPIFPSRLKDSHFLNEKSDINLDELENDFNQEYVTEKKVSKQEVITALINLVEKVMNYISNTEVKDAPIYGNSVRIFKGRRVGDLFMRPKK